MKWLKIVGKKTQHNFSEPKLTYLNLLFCVTNRPKPKDIQFTIIDD